MSPPRMLVTGMAKDVVMLRAKTDNRISKAFPESPPSLINFPNAAVPNKAPKLEISMAETTMKRFSTNNFFRLYILTAKLTTDGPRQNKRRSPAPALFQAKSLVLR